MSEESLKEILLNIKPGDYQKIMSYPITQEDIEDFYNLYNEFISLENDYHQMFLKRKEVAPDLVKKLELLEQMGELIARGMKVKKEHYENFAKDLKNTRIDDYYKVLEVLKQLANNDTVEYEIKIIQYPTYDSSERHGYRTTEEYTGEITILAEKESLSKFDSSKKMPFLSQDMLLEIYQQGFSMILVGNDEYITERLDLPNKQSLGHYCPIVFYLQGDELATATSSFMSFIGENGADLSQMEINDLVQLIKSKYQKRKKLV